MKNINEENIIDKIANIASIYPAKSALSIICQDILNFSYNNDKEGLHVKVGTQYLSLYPKNDQLIISKIDNRKAKRKIIREKLLTSGSHKKNLIYQNGLKKYQTIKMHHDMILTMDIIKKEFYKTNKLVSHLKCQDSLDFFDKFDEKSMALKEFLFFAYSHDFFKHHNLGIKKEHKFSLEFIEFVFKKHKNFDLLAKILLKEQLQADKRTLRNNRFYMNCNGVKFLP